MWTTADTTAALAEARNTKKTFSSVKAGKPAAPDADQSNTVSGLLEALSAVIPTGITAAYTGLVLLLSGWAVKHATDEHSAAVAAMVKDKKTPAQVQAYLDGLPAESEQLWWLRVVLLVVALLTAVAVVYRAGATANKKSGTHSRRFIFAEPFSAGVAFLGWSLATPGTPLAAKYTTDELFVITLVIAGCTAFVLYATGAIALTKPANTTK